MWKTGQIIVEFPRPTLSILSISSFSVQTGPAVALASTVAVYQPLPGIELCEWRSVFAPAMGDMVPFNWNMWPFPAGQEPR